MREKVFERYPMMRSTPSNGGCCFERSGDRPSQTPLARITPLDRPSIVPQFLTEVRPEPLSGPASSAGCPFPEREPQTASIDR